ncbi:hypothetical protein SAMN04487996_12781 [Dyadobacter soli]|uniref:Lipocalin-like domain-containing protein n=1 Tax=Dyadobacter soli TaxID=659014 RepID=A0A1G7Z750_9BACT|nr:hypothetical protein [Dyadobacter soli]SDH04326.1 hypothetical protein SAMN04487996_12781 [Dyadobacter soli]
MKRLLYIPLILVWLLSCKKDSFDDLAPNAAFSGVTGVWHAIEIERSSLDNKSTWEPIAAAKSDSLIFRGDGVVLNVDGTPRCCAPATMIINGQLVDVKPQTALPNNAQCEKLNCVTCPTWEISLSDDQLIIGTCNAPRMKYVR